MLREFVRSANGYDVDEASLASGLLCEDESLAVQSQKDEADINVLVRRFGVTGTIPVIELPAAILGHVEEFDLMAAHSILIEARQSFASLDADLRSRFNNDPMRFVAFCEDKKNLEELRKLGLAPPAPVPVPEIIQKVKIIGDDDGRSEERRTGGRQAARARGARETNSEES